MSEPSDFYFEASYIRHEPLCSAVFFRHRNLEWPPWSLRLTLPYNLQTILSLAMFGLGALLSRSP